MVLIYLSHKLRTGLMFIHRQTCNASLSAILCSILPSGLLRQPGQEHGVAGNASLQRQHYQQPKMRQRPDQGPVPYQPGMYVRMYVCMSMAKVSVIVHTNPACPISEDICARGLHNV